MNDNINRMATKHFFITSKFSIIVYCLALTVTILCSFNVKAQNWAPNGAIWTYTQTHVFSPVIDTLVIRSIGDTVILGKECKILKRNNGTCDLRPIFEFMYSEGEKVFFYDDSREEFQMLYNFGALQGQSFTIFISEFSSTDSIVVTIDSVKSVELDNVLLKKQFVSYKSSNWAWVIRNHSEIIENIGDTWSLFPWYFGACDVNWGGPLRCYEDSILGLIDFGTAPSCDYVVLGISNNDLLEEIGLNVSVKPNPAKEFAAFDYVLPIQESSAILEISNVTGVHVASLNLYGNKGQKLWDTRNIPSGTYIFTIKVAGFTKSGKLVIINK